MRLLIKISKLIQSEINELTQFVVEQGIDLDKQLQGHKNDCKLLVALEA